MENYLDGFIEELLHINDVGKNKLLDLTPHTAADFNKVYYLQGANGSVNSEYTLRVIEKRIGKVANTILKQSALVASEEQIIGKNINLFDWANANGQKDSSSLNTFITDVYKELNLRGNNPLFLSVGAIKWKIATSKNEVSEVLSPLLIFPIKLVRAGNINSVSIEFIDDDIYFNPCLYYKMKQVLGEEVANCFPHPNGITDMDTPVLLEKLGDGVDYFEKVKQYMDDCKRDSIGGNVVFELEKDIVAIAQYKHDELAMHYDIKRNKDKIYAHPLVQRVFKKNSAFVEKITNVNPDCVLPRDSYQQKIIERVVGGESLVIKGPPGTGKTLTIANMIATLLGDNKKVMLASKKLSALAEVRNKLPERLRKFVMLLDYETEAQIAKVSPSTIKTDFKNLVKQKREYTKDSNANVILSQGKIDCSNSLQFLATYNDDMFIHEDVAGRNCYDALDIVLKQDLPKIPFADMNEVQKLSLDEYIMLHSAVCDGGAQYDTLTSMGAHSIAKNPWYAVAKKIDTDSAFEAYKDIKSLAEQVQEQLGNLDLGINLNNLSILDTLMLMQNDFDKDALSQILTKSDKLSEEDIKQSLKLFLENKYNNDKFSFKLASKENVDILFEQIKNLSVDESLTLQDIENLCSNISIFYNAQGDFLSEDKIGQIIKLMQKVEELKAVGKEFLLKVCNVFTDDIVKANAKLLREAIVAFEGYSAEAEKPKLLDLKAKKYFAKLAPLCYRNCSFGEIVQGAKDFREYDTIAKEVSNLTDNTLRKILQCAPTNEQVDCLTKTINRSIFVGLSAKKYISEAQNAYLICKQCADKMSIVGEYNIGELKKAFASEVYKLKLERVLNNCEEVLGAKLIESDCDIAKLSNVAVALKAIIGLFGGENMPVEDKIAVILKLSKAKNLGENLASLIFKLENFGKNNFANYYTDVGNVAWDDLKILVGECCNRDMLSASLRYKEILKDEKLPLDIRKFFVPFELGIVSKKASFGDIFESTVYNLAVDSKLKRVRFDRNGIGKQIAYNLDKFGLAEQKLFDGNSYMIESKCMQRIDPDDPDFNFLNAERNTSESLRKMFKNYAAAILKIKKCMILSPSTVSVLFGAKEYEDFDVVIIDEASQLEPVNLLPILFRAKQCVIVGDEWQMPPIHFFKAKYDATEAEIEENAALEPELSALALALRNNAFDVEQLVCHYRSKTESLIKYSQKRFYPYMRTFPVPQPKTEDLGISDIYVEDGVCDGGENIREAECVILEMKKHFERYYDEKTKKLSMPLGIIAFGEKQIDKIKKMVLKDTDLSKKIDDALSAFDDAPEKLIFFKTIEKVQGQETGHVILSMTYGKQIDATTGAFKIVQAFGQLNRGSLGECIFNVAVTRAKSRVTVIHSVRAIDITNDNIQYIKNYLEISQKFNQNDKGQFVGGDTKSGFLLDVAKFVQDCGIERERIVFNYGVTDGSVRIPIAILSKDLQTAQLAIWCERPLDNKYNYIDYNVRYYNILKSNGWNMHRIFIHDWLFNSENEKKALADKIKKYI